MPHIISDHEYRELKAWRATGLTPERAMDLAADEEAPMPLALWESARTREEILYENGHEVFRANTKKESS